MNIFCKSLLCWINYNVKFSNYQIASIDIGVKSKACKEFSGKHLSSFSKASQPWTKFYIHLLQIQTDRIQLLLFAHLISVSVMLYFPVYTTIVCEVGKINLSNAMLSKSGPGRIAGGGRSKPTKTTHTPPRETGERREGRSICFSYSPSWAARRGQQSSGHWCGPFNHTCVLLASPLNTTTGPKSNCQ